MQNVSENLCEFQKHFEGVRYKPYRDTGGVLTIGIGHTNKDLYYFDENSVWTDDDVFQAWSIDIQEAVASANRYLVNDVEQNVFDVTVDLIFNCGKPRTYVDMLNAGDYDGARAQILRWIYDNGKVQLGLVKRCFARYMYFVGDDYMDFVNCRANFKNLKPLNDLIEPLGYFIRSDSKTQFRLQRIA